MCLILLPLPRGPSKLNVLLRLPWTATRGFVRGRPGSVFNAEFSRLLAPATARQPGSYAWACPTSSRRSWRTRWALGTPSRSSSPPSSMSSCCAPRVAGGQERPSGLEDWAPCRYPQGKGASQRRAEDQLSLDRVAAGKHPHYSHKEDLVAVLGLGTLLSQLGLQGHSGKAAAALATSSWTRTSQADLLCTPPWCRQGSTACGPTCGAAA